MNDETTGAGRAGGGGSDEVGPTDSAIEWRSAPVRTFHARHGRSSPTLQRLLDHVVPTVSLPPGPLDGAAVFGRVAPLVLEIGCGHGAAALAYARAHPDHDVVAVDIHRPGIARLAEAAAGLPNLRVALVDGAELLAGRVPAGAIAAVHLFFPDPWPKTKHHKRRFVRPDLVDLVARALRPGGRFLIATDEPSYAEQVDDVVGRDGRFTGGRGPRPSWRPVAGYEHKAVEAGRPIVDFAYVRREW